jgi:hypothetical protein
MLGSKEAKVKKLAIPVAVGINNENGEHIGVAVCSRSEILGRCVEYADNPEDVMPCRYCRRQMFLGEVNRCKEQGIQM